MHSLDPNPMPLVEAMRDAELAILEAGRDFCEKNITVCEVGITANHC